MVPCGWRMKWGGQIDRVGWRGLRLMRRRRGIRSTCWDIHISVNPIFAIGMFKSIYLWRSVWYLSLHRNGSSYTQTISNCLLQREGKLEWIFDPWKLSTLWYFQVVWTVVASILIREDNSHLGDSLHTAPGGLREEGGGAQCLRLSWSGPDHPPGLPVPLLMSSLKTVVTNRQMFDCQNTQKLKQISNT